MKARKRLVWAMLGAAVLCAGIIALVVAGLGKGGTTPPAQTPPQSGSPSATSTPPPTSSDLGFVDPSVTELGWVPEPITQDPETYARAALEAAGTFDTRLATRSEWVDWLESWFTLSPLYDQEQDALDQMAGYKAELDQAVVLPQSAWDDLASEDGRVSSRVASEIQYLELPETTQKKVWTASADVVMTYTRSADGGDVEYEETVRVTVQVVCGGVSVPVPGSSQRPGDCKVVRFFDEAVG
jgi:hypothetical protein